MKSGLNILILGGDNRYLEVINILASNNMNIFLNGFNKLSFEDPSIHNLETSEIDFSIMDAILLPVSGTDKDGEIEATYSNTSIRLTEKQLQQTPDHCTIYTGISNDFLDKITHSSNRKMVRLFARNDIAIYNSIPTAEATLKIAIEETDVMIHGSEVLVIGFGRVGITVARLFAALGAKVTVAARKSEHFARIAEMGLKSIETSRIENIVSNMNICINTVPHSIIGPKIIDQMTSSTLIIDLASKPGGTDFDYANEKGIKTIHALGLPGKTAPRTAGEIIGGVLLELIQS
ncbi:dipicolinate synthase subunit DpsA [Oceanobacillus caeni]|uniref:Dipicolinate synthase subunit A n=1 Tax=Oceanobacillus caeni TaxID=405946 RepID=A0ABR5MK33_9BACI|nr:MULTISPECIES: dipicolinate synthase subunit DpsA [Bacillaceae]KPH75829.1 dipicolinate synthase subunit A [Oceanobacillus caeni]MCR1835041.1 dipicolinate synthase subunit DpsA [Oceanobacillus caeni]MED4473726.1 dipicolinate synthase subunit DpsA [Oceanobacillus caeni]